MVIEITASNFALLSKREQDMRIFAYAGLLNSLTFPIQILIRNKRMDITNYIKELQTYMETTKNQQLTNYIRYYSEFVHEMVTVNVVLNKAFYIILPFSSLELGVTGAGQTQQKGRSEVETFALAAKKILQTKSESVLGQLQKFATSAKILEKEELVKLYYDIYNEDNNADVNQIQEGADASFVTGRAKQ